MPARRSATIAGALCAALAVLAGCGDADETMESAPELSAELTQSRLDQSIGAVSVSVANDGDAPVRVDDLVLHAPPFPDQASDNDAVVLPGQRVDFRVTYGEPSCAGARPTLEAAIAEATVDGRAAQIDIDDSDDALARLLAMRCGAQQLAEVVDVRFGPSWTLTADGSAVLGTIELSRVGAGPEVVLLEVGGSVVYGLEPIRADEPVATLAADQTATSVPVRAVSIRCDPHALGEGRGKKNHIFRLWFVLDGDPTEIYTELKAGPAIQALLDQLCAG